jgi:hypothetical protein
MRPISAGVAVGKRRRLHPGVERGLVAPPGDHQPRCAIVGGLEQLEAFEPFGIVDRPGPGGKAMASSSPPSAGTVMALILMIDMLRRYRPDQRIRVSA